MKEILFNITVEMLKNIVCDLNKTMVFWLWIKGNGREFHIRAGCYVDVAKDK